MEEFSYSICMNAKSIIKVFVIFIQSQEYFSTICRRFQKSDSIAFIKQIDEDIKCQNEKQKQLIKCFVEAQYLFGYSLFKTSKENNSINIKMINIIREERKITEMQNKLNCIVEHFSKLISDSRYSKYHESIKWIPGLLESDEYGDFLLQLDELYALMQKIDNKNSSQSLNLGYVLLHQNFNENCHSLLHVASFIQYLNHLNVVKENQQQQEAKHIKPSKIIYLNLTGKETQKNLNFWSCFNHQYEKNCQYYALMPPINPPPLQEENSTCIQSVELNKENKSTVKLMYSDGNKGYVIPNIYQHTFIPLYFPPNQEQKQLKKEFIDQIYLDVLKKRFTDFQPNFIFLEILISEEFSIEELGLESLVRKLTKIAKVVVHIKIDINMEPKVIFLLARLNAIINGMQGLKSVGKIRFNQHLEQQQQIQWLRNQSFLISQSRRKCGELIFTHCQFAKQIEKKYKVKILNYFNIQIYFEGKLQIIKPKTQNNKDIKYDLERISYKHELIVLYNHSTSIIYFQKFPFGQIGHKQSPKGDPQQIELKFEEIEIMSESKIIEPSILITEKLIILAYGQKENSQFNDQIIIIDRNNRDNQILQRKDWVHFKDENNNNSKTYFDSSNNVVERIKNRRGQQVCENTIFLKNEFLSFLLIGGESIDSSEMSLMNIIECVMIDLSNQKFCSQIMSKSSLSKFTSLKPWPYQVVLNCCTQSQQSFTLILCGNNQNKINQFSFPLNPNHYNFAQLLVKNESKISLLNVQVQTGENYWRIEKIMNSQHNQILIEKTDTQIVWKVFFKRIMQFKKPKLIKDLEQYENLIQSNNFNNLVLVYLEYSIILKIKDKTNLFVSDVYDVEIKSSLQSIQNIQE